MSWQVSFHVKKCALQISFLTFSSEVTFSSEANNTLTCDWRFEHAKHITIHVVVKIFWSFSTNSETNASESWIHVSSLVIIECRS